MNPPLSYLYEFAARTDVGRVRSNNEDAFVINEKLRLVVVADGMGGYNSGEVASALAVQCIEAHVHRWTESLEEPLVYGEIRDILTESIDKANREILSSALVNPQHLGMGTTVVLGWLYADRLYVAHLGDSRAYRFRDRHLVQLTRDHSWLQEQVDAGLLTQQQAAVSSQRNLVTRALGVELVVRPDINEFDVEPQDLYLLCSDGLTDMMSEDDISDILGASVSLKEKVDRLVALANTLGGRDNISALLVQTDGQKPSKPLTGIVSRLLGAQ